MPDPYKISIWVAHIGEKTRMFVGARHASPALVIEQPCQRLLRGPLPCERPCALRTRLGKPLPQRSVGHHALHCGSDCVFIQGIEE